MSFIFNWLGRISGERGRSVGDSERVYAPNTQIPYRPDLIDGLQDDHQQLAQDFTRLVDAARGGKAKEIRFALDEFEGRLYDHLLREKTSFYFYIRGIYAHDEAMLELVNYFSVEMDNIQREVIRFFKRHKHATFSNEEVRILREELKGLGAALTDRIRREESQLYPLYQHPDNVG